YIKPYTEASESPLLSSPGTPGDMMAEPRPIYFYQKKPSGNETVKTVFGILQPAACCLVDFGKFRSMLKKQRCTIQPITRHRASTICGCPCIHVLTWE